MDRAAMWITVGWEPSPSEARAAAGVVVAGELKQPRARPEDVGLVWAQPELVLFDRSRDRDHGYPDLIFGEEKGEVPPEVPAAQLAVYLTESYKGAGAHDGPNASSEARTHKICPLLLSRLYNQRTNTEAAAGGKRLVPGCGRGGPTPCAAPAWPDLSTPLAAPRGARPGFTVELWTVPTKRSFWAGGVAEPPLLADRDALGRGVSVSATDAGALRLAVVDQKGVETQLDTDEACTARLLAPARGVFHHYAAVVDANAMIASVMVDGKLCDGDGVGSKTAWAGWGYVAKGTGAIKGSASAAGAEVDWVADPSRPLESDGAVLSARVYETALLTSDLVGNFRSGLAERLQARFQDSDTE
jgi:hypothetical protein